MHSLRRTSIGGAIFFFRTFNRDRGHRLEMTANAHRSLDSMRLTGAIQSSVRVDTRLRGLELSARAYQPAVDRRVERIARNSKQYTSFAGNDAGIVMRGRRP